MSNLTTLHIIGQGGFGTVELVQNAFGQQFARKIFSVNQPLQDSLRENVLRRFRREIQIQGSIQDRNIVPILNAELNAQPPYYLMPVAISSLDKDIAAHKTLNNNFMVALSDIVAGLEALHRLHIFHRDLKPQNVLRFNDQAQGNDYYAISDFGLISIRESQLSVLTATGMTRGADYYTAPEVTNDLRRASIQSDIYSLGCILHDFIGQSARVPCGEIHEDSPFGPILIGCTRRNPNQRFRSARAVLDAVLSVSSFVPIPTTQQAADFAAILERDPTSVPHARWRDLADFLYTVAMPNDARAIFMRLNENCIGFICRTVPIEAKIIGLSFAAWITESAFNFDYCDGLANRLETFFQSLNDYELKASCLMALLAMGTSHNRWYVEHKFIHLTGTNMDTALATRLAIEFRILGQLICNQINHLEISISADRTALHPQLQQALSQICR